MDKQEIYVPTVTLKWSEWTKWSEIEIDTRSGNAVTIPNGRPGVYEARHNNSQFRLTIGKASDLRRRVRQGLVKGKALHSSGKKIRALEDISTIIVRWAETDRPAAVEEKLHRLHKEQFGDLPKYTEH